VHLTPGNQTLTLWADDGKNNRSASVAVKVVARIVVIDHPPVAVISSPRDGDVFNISETVLFDGSGSYDPENATLKFTWLVDGLVESEAASYSKPMPEGTYRIVLEVSDGTHRVSTEEISISVIDLPPVISLTLDGVELDGLEPVTWPSNRSIYLDASGSYDPEGTELSYLWYVNGDPVSAFSYMGRILKPGNYAVKLEVTDLGGKTSARTVWIEAKKANDTVNPPPDDDVIDDDVRDDDGEKGFFEAYGMFIIIAVAVLVLLAVLCIIGYLALQRRRDVGAGGAARAGGRQRRKPLGGRGGEEDILEWDEE
jgi:hypothetical protein